MDNQNPYDFLYQQPANQKKPVFAGGGPASGGNKILKIVLFLTGVSILLIAGLVVFGMLTKVDYSDTVNVAKEQQKLLYLAERGMTDSQNLDTKSLSAVISATMNSDAKAVSAFLTKEGQENAAKQAAAASTSELGKTLDSALKTNSFDTAFKEELSKLVTSYSAKLKMASADATKKSEQTLIKNAQDNIAVIAKSLE